MDGFKDILVVVSPGPLHLPDVARVLELAAVERARVTVLDVVEPIPARRRLVDIEGQAVDLQERLLRDRCDQLHRATADLAAGGDVTVQVVAGKVVVEVVRHVLASGHDLVVVGAPAPDGHGVDVEVLQLLRKCPVPVWVVRPEQGDDCRVLALVDPDPDEQEYGDLDDRVLGLATTVAQKVGGPLHVGHAWRLPGESELRSSSFVRLPAAEVDAMAAAAAAEHRARVVDLVERHRATGLDVQVHLPKGTPGSVLPTLADHLSIDLVVMGTVGRTGLSGLVMGNTAERILRAITGSVLEVKPPGFTSPVRADPPAEGVSC